MPLKRTPPPVSPSVTPIATASKNVDRESQLKASGELRCDYESMMNVTMRKKDITKHLDDDALCCEDTDVLTQVKQMISTFTKKWDTRFQKLEEAIDSIRQQNTGLAKSVDLISEKHDEILGRISKLETEKKENQRIICLLEERVESVERKMRNTGLEVRNIQRNKSETKETLCSIIIKLGQILNIKIKNSDIRDIYRINSKDKSDPIIIEFTTVFLKEKVLKETKTFNKNKNKTEKLNSNHLQLNQSTKPVYISETLTNKTQRLFFLSRTFQKNYNYSFCWTAHGTVYLRKDISSPHIKIVSEEQLEILRKKE